MRLFQLSHSLSLPSQLGIGHGRARGSFKPECVVGPSSSSLSSSSSSPSSSSSSSSPAPPASLPLLLRTAEVARFPLVRFCAGPCWLLLFPVVSLPLFEPVVVPRPPCPTMCIGVRVRVLVFDAVDFGAVCGLGARYPEILSRCERAAGASEKSSSRLIDSYGVELSGTLLLNKNSVPPGT